MTGRTLSILLVIGMSAAASAADPSTGEASRIAMESGPAGGGGSVAGVRIESAVLFKTLDAHGHEIDPKTIECASCRKAFAAAGFCGPCRIGYVEKKLYTSQVSYALAKGEPRDPKAITCRACRENATRPPETRRWQEAWCDACGLGMVGNLAFKNRADFDRATRAYDVLRFAVRTSGRCETCAVVVFTGGMCPTCRLSYRDGSMVPAVLRDPILFFRAPDAGLRHAYYEGQWRSVREVENATAAREGVIGDFDLAARGRDEHFALVFDGFVEVPADGIYRFFLASDDGSQLLIAGDIVVDNDGRHGMMERSGVAGLKAGYHPITVRYFNATGTMGLRVGIAGPGLEKQIIPMSMLFR